MCRQVAIKQRLRQQQNLPLASVDILVVLGTIVWMIVAVWPHFRWCRI
jgi:hypothetical protein